MRLPLHGLICLGAAVASLTCAPSSQSGTGDADPLTYRKNLGTGTTFDIERYARRILERHNYQLEPDASSPQYLAIRTRWYPRSPLQDENARGVVEAMTRITVTARARGQGRGSADLRAVEFAAENMVLIGDSTAWRQGFMTPMVKEYLDRIADELKTQLRSGLRVF